MCLPVFVGSLLLTETGRLFPSLMLSSEVGCQHLCRQWNYDAEKKISWEVNMVKPTSLHDRKKQESPPANGMFSYHQQTEIFVSVVP